MVCLMWKAVSFKLCIVWVIVIVGISVWIIIIFILFVKVIISCCIPHVCLVSVPDDVVRLQLVLECAQRHIHSSSQLFKLAQDAFKIATPSDAPKCMPALKAAFELGLQVCWSFVNVPEFEQCRCCFAWFVLFFPSVNVHIRNYFLPGKKVHMRIN